MRVYRECMGSYRISELAQRSGMTASTLRFYEDLGLLTAERTPSGYRMYDDTAVDRLEFISSAKAMGMTLDDIRNLLQVWQSGACASVRTELAPLIDQRLADTEQRIAELTAFAQRLHSIRSGLAGPAPSGACRPGCGCLIDTPAPLPAGRRDLRLTAADADVVDEAPAIACSLGRDELGDRVQDWHDILSTATSRGEVGSAGPTVGVRYDFTAAAATTAALAGLIAAETQCCSFYTFTLGVSATEITLDVRAPQEAQPLLDDLFGTILANGH